MFNFQRISLYHLRTLLKRVLDLPTKKDRSQTGYLFYGQPSSGKSSLADFIATLVGQSLTTKMPQAELRRQLVLSVFRDKPSKKPSKKLSTVPSKALQAEPQAKSSGICGKNVKSKKYYNRTA